MLSLVGVSIPSPAGSHQGPVRPARGDQGVRRIGIVVPRGGSGGIPGAATPDLVSVPHR